MTEFEVIRNLSEKLDKKPAPRRVLSSITKDRKTAIRKDLAKNVKELNVTLKAESTKEVTKALIEMNAFTLQTMSDLGIEYHKEFNNLIGKKLEAVASAISDEDSE